MAALGGFFGGGINSAATDFVQSKNLANMNRTQALQELIYMVNNGEEADFLKGVVKMKVGDKNLSANSCILSDRNEDGSNSTVYAEASGVQDS
jgi:outer membrane PBP1 activator LpoA protein